jgi:hypothetical protein
VPQLRAVVPIEQTLLLLTPALAVCAWLGWRVGGRLWFAIAWTVITVWVLSRPLAGGGAYAAFARGWGLLLAASFGAIGLLMAEHPFFSRAFRASVIAGVAAAIALALAGAGPVRLERVIAGELTDRVESSISGLRNQIGTPRWQELERRNPDGAKALTRMMETSETQLRQLAPAGATLFPAILAFESIAALGLAWSLYHRLARVRLGPPLAPIRAFRFNDQLIWGAIAGLVLVLVPRFAALKGVGINLLVFFGALYALRGLGVMVWFLVAPGRWLGMVIIILVCLVPLAWSVPLGIGLGDTWFDWRRRLRASKTGAKE